MIRRRFSSLLLCAITIVAADDLTDGIANGEAAVLTMKAAIEDAYNSRCGITQEKCADLNYDACQSVLTIDAACSADAWLNGTCDETCGSVRDATTSNIRLPAVLADGIDLNPTDPDVIEAICYSILAEAEMIAAVEQDTTLGIQKAYFGSVTGAFRIFPATPWEECGTYDCRIRPWFVAASTGPKDVVLLIDVSYSMLEQSRLELAKNATIAVINTMTNTHFVAVVVFSKSATVLGSFTTLQRATDAVKFELIAAVSALEVDTSTNFGAGFTEVFDLFDASETAGKTASCLKTIIMLTDGKISPDTLNETAVSALINDRNADHNADVFTYALGSEADFNTTKKIACQTGGIAEKIPDGGDLLSSMAGYYLFYATGMGYGAANRTSWVEPYTFATGGVGTTCSSPVYDFSAEPPLFLGVVAVDFTLDTFLSANDGYDAVLLRLVDASSFCPVFNLTECEQQAFRASVSADSVCEDQCSSDQQLSPAACLSADEYPTSLWQNVDNADKSYHERACCTPGVAYDAASDECAACEKDCGGGGGGGGLSLGAVIGISAAAVLVLVAVVCWQRKRFVEAFGAAAAACRCPCDKEQPEGRNGGSGGGMTGITIVPDPSATAGKRAMAAAAGKTTCWVPPHTALDHLTLHATAESVADGPSKPSEGRLPPLVCAAAALGLLGIAKAVNLLTIAAAKAVQLGELAKRRLVKTFDVDGDGTVQPHEVLRTLLRERFYRQLCWLLESPWVGMATSLLICGGALHEVFEAGAHGLKTHLGVCLIGVSHFLHYLREFLKEGTESDEEKERAGSGI